MSSTSTTTTAGQSSPPDIKILHRVVSIPMISSSLVTINDALSSNAYTRSPYSTAKGLSTSAFKYTEPLQIKLAPLIERADGYANKAVDAVEQRYPYPFKAKPEEVVTYVRDRKQSATDFVHERTASVNRTIDERVKSPAYSVAQGIDQRFAPIVDYFEVAVHRLNSEPGSSNVAPDSKYQYQRALALSKNLKDHIYEYSNEQIKQLQAQSVLVQRASETAHSIADLATNSMSTAQQRIHALSDTMLAELQKLQSSTSSFATSIQSSASTTLHNNIHTIQHNIPPQLQQTYAELTSNLANVISELKSTMMEKDLPIQEKVGKMGSQVKESVTPLLEAVRKRVEALLATGKGKAAETSEKVKETGEKVKETGEQVKGQVNGVVQQEFQQHSPRQSPSQPHRKRAKEHKNADDTHESPRRGEF